MIARFLIFGLMVLVAGCGSDGNGNENGDVLTKERWTSSEDLQVSISQLDQPPTLITTGFDDFKPVWSVTGDMLTFFRRYQSGSIMQNWKTKIAVINVDGTGLREVTGGDYMDCNQTWTRDGSNRIVFNRFGHPNIDNNAVYITSPDAEAGEEILISHPQEGFEWVFSALKDGRVFIERTDMDAPGGTTVTQSFLLTINLEGIGFYEEIQRPTTKQWHTLSVSPTETKVTYMLDNDDLRTTYQDAVLYYADFDIATLTISNPVPIADEDLSYVDMYPRWTADESLIVYSSNRSGTSQLYAYKLSDATTQRISHDENVSSEFSNFESCPK
jgi:hypothetical protein